MDEQVKTIVVSGANVTLKQTGDGEGEVRAIFATLDVEDRHGDIIKPRAIGSQRVLMSSYGHGSWGGFFQPPEPHAWPVGKGKTTEDKYKGEKVAIFEGKLFTDMDHALETLKLIKNVGDQQEWSFSLQDIKADYQTDEDGSRRRIIKKTNVHEVSPVFQGAGIGTRTLSAKDRANNTLIDQMRELLESKTGDPDLASEIEKLEAKVTQQAEEIQRLNKELRQERNAQAHKLFNGVTL